MKKRMIAIAAATMATMMMATPVLAEDYKIGICNYVDDASLNQIVDNLESRLKEIGDEKGVNFDISYDNCNADANVMEQIISDFRSIGSGWCRSCRIPGGTWRKPYRNKRLSGYRFHYETDRSC